MPQLISPPQTTFSPPAWVHEFIHTHSTTSILLTRTIPGASHLNDTSLQQKVRSTYDEILAEASSQKKYPIRFWNNVPQLTTPASQQRNRYMVFNAARYEALSAFYGDPSRFEHCMPAATAVGAEAVDLKIHCLASSIRVTPLNNPRQVAPYHYSKRFGPLPPCFSRAVLLNSPRWLLIGGTAAIRGEDSVYREDLQRQLTETFANLAALICAAQGETHTSDQHLQNHLSHYRRLRIYFPNAEHEPLIRTTVQNTFTHVRDTELVLADLCRSELLVEIEGVAELKP